MLLFKNNKLKVFLNILNTVAFLLITYLIYKNILSFFYQTEYRHLHIDERQLIDSILNVFQIQDEYGRYKNLESGILKSFLIIITELIIGGNLDYGRFYSNLFVFFSGPFYFINFKYLIISERILQLTIYIITLLYISKFFIEKNYKYIFILFGMSVPGSYYLIQNPKPDPLVILLFFVGLKKIFFDENYKTSFIFFGMSIGIKIVSIIPLFTLFLVLKFQNQKFKTFKELSVSVFYFLIGLIIAQPALLIPSRKIYSRIFSAIKGASVYNQDEYFTLNSANVNSWLQTLSKEYSLSEVIFVLVFLITFTLFLKSLNESKYISTFYLFTFLFFTVFIIFNVERTWSYYLAFPFIFLLVYLFQENEHITFKKLVLLFPILIIVINGLAYHNEKAVDSYFIISQPKEQTFQEIVAFLDTQYSSDNFKYNFVYWDPDLYFPRYKINYKENFQVLENWELDAGINPLISKVDFIVSLQKINYTSKDIKELNIGEAHIYYLNK